MSIRSNIQARIDQIMDERQARDLDPESPAHTSDAVENGSRAAIFGGRASKDWKAYMQLFANSTAELDRLVPPQQDPNPTREKARAYLVCNGMCGMTTGENLGDHIEDKLDF